MKKNISFKYALIIVLIIALPCTKAFTQTSTNLPSIAQIASNLSKTKYEELLDGNALVYISNARDKLRMQYMPQIQLFEELINYADDKNPQILYENLFFLPETNYNEQEKKMLLISNLLRNVPILENIEYQNQNDGNIHPLFKSSAVVKSDSDWTRIDAPVALSKLPTQYTELQIAVRQDMPPFDYVNSRYTYRYNSHYSAFVGSNTSTIKYSYISAVKKTHMFTSAWLMQTKEGVLIYGVGAVRISGVASFFKNVLANSFSSRMQGLFEWMNKELSE